MWAVQGILAALYERQRTGKGRLVECSLLETVIGFSSWTSAQWLADYEEPTRIGEGVRVPNVAPKLGEHNAEIFGWLGLSTEEMKALRKQKVI